MLKRMFVSPVVSIIITTRNNHATLIACLESIRQQTYEPTELIIVDNNSTDDTLTIAQRFTKHVYTKGPERSAQRNYGVQQANGEFIFIIDSDMELPPTVVAECVAQINDKTAAVIVPELSFGEGFWAKCKALERSFYVGVDWIEAPRFFDKAIYLQAGGYDEQMAGGEDWDLGVRVRILTYVAHTKTMIRHNEGHLTLRSMIKKRRYYAKGFRNYYEKSTTQRAARSPFMQVLGVYGLFARHPVKLFKNPITGICMLLMKTAEFGAISSTKFL